MGKWLQMLTQAVPEEGLETIKETEKREEIKRGEKVETTQCKNYSSIEVISANTDVIEIKTLPLLNAYGILPDDKIFVNRVLLYKPEKEKQQVIDQYCAIWLRYYQQNKANPITCENRARYHANEWLRKKYLR
jgi:hypothetical protein